MHYRFSIVFLVNMTMFPVALLYLKFHRSRLPRNPVISVELLILALIISATVIIGNIVLNPAALG